MNKCKICGKDTTNEIPGIDKNYCLKCFMSIEYKNQKENKSLVGNQKFLRSKLDRFLKE